MNKFKKVLISKTRTIIFILVVLALYLAVNYYVQFVIDLPVIDITEQKVYTLSDVSKNAIKDIEQEVIVYLYGYTEKSAVVNLMKQYNKNNPNIVYTHLTDETNPSMIKEYELEEGYQVLIIESEGKRVLKSSNEFETMDFNTYETLDLTEQEITNGILNVTLANNPKVYFLTGHGEITLDSLYVLKTYLELEANEVAELNLLSTESVPEDCKVLAIAAPQADISDNERNKILDFLSKGGNLFVTTGLTQTEQSFVNLQSVLDFFGVNYNYGYIAETDTNYAHESSKIITFPILDSENAITADIASARLSVTFPTAGRITVKSDGELSAINTTVNTLLKSSSSATFVTDASIDVNTAIENGEKGEFIEAVSAERTIEENSTNLFDDTGNVKAKLVYIANDLFMADYVISEINTEYPLSYLGGNRDLALNSISYLNDRTDTISVRKSIGTATFSTTEFQSTQVLVFIFAMPIAIIIAGILVYRNRKRKI